MRLHLNIPLSLCLSALIVLGGCDSKADRKTRYLNQGKEQLEAKNYDKARISFKNVLQIDPNDQDGLYQFGKLNEAKQEFQQAFALYNKVVEINPNHIGANLALTKFNLAGNALDKAENYLATVESAEPNNLDAKVLRAALFARHNNAARAMEILADVLTKDPNHREGLAMQAGMHTDAGRDDQAQASLDKSLAQYPNDVTFLTLQSRLYQKRNQMDLAWSTYEKIALLEPENFTKTSEIIKLFIQNKQNDRAVGLLDKFITTNPEHTESKIAKAELLQLFGRKDEAKTLLTDYIAKYPKEFSFGIALATHNLKIEGSRPDAIKQLKQIATDAVGTPSELQALNLLARIYTEDKEVDQAKAAVDLILSKSAKDLEALEVRGAIALHRKDYTQAIGDFRAVLADKPTQIKLYPALANAHVSNGEIELAMTVLREGVKANPTNVALHLELGSYLQRSNDLKGAQAQFEEAVKLDSHNVKALDSLINIYLDQKNGAAIRKYSEPLQQDKQLGRLATYYTALSYNADEAPQKAISIFDELLKEKPDFIEVISARAKSMLQMGQSTQARAWLRQQTLQQPKQPVIFNLIGELALSDKDYPQAIEAFQAAINLQDTWVTPYSHLANAQRKNNNIPAAEATLQKGLSKQPNNILLLNDLASLYEANKQPDKAIQLYDSFYKSNGEPEIIGNNLAMLLATYRTDAPSNQQALSLAERLRSSKNPLYLDTAAWVYYKQGRINDAKTLLLDAQSKFDTPVINYHLGAVFLAEKDKNSAKTHLEKAQASKANYPGRAEAEALLKTIAQE